MSDPEYFESAYDYSPNYDENFTWPQYFETIEEENKWLILISNVASYLEKANLILSAIGLICNLLHFLVMIQKGMRTSSINILTIGISVCDITVIGYTVGSYIYDIFYWDKCWPKSTYLSRWVLLVFEFLINLLLRLSPWLGLAMALIRATVILFPWKKKISRLSEKPTGILTMSFLSFLSFLITSFLMARFSIFKDGLWIAPQGYGRSVGVSLISSLRCGYPPNYNQTKYIVLVGRKVIFSDSTSKKLYGVVNGAASVIPAVLYPVIAIVLLVQLWKIGKNRNKLFSRRTEEKDHTTQLVILMTITFFISQLPFGLSMWLRLVFPYHSVISSLLDHGKEITSILFTINATCHCIIFATLSVQYRVVAREVYCCGKMKSASVSTRSVVGSQKENKTNTLIN